MVGWPPPLVNTLFPHVEPAWERWGTRSKTKRQGSFLQPCSELPTLQVLCGPKSGGFCTQPADSIPNTAVLVGQENGQFWQVSKWRWHGWPINSISEKHWISLNFLSSSHVAACFACRLDWVNKHLGSSKAYFSACLWGCFLRKFTGQGGGGWPSLNMGRVIAGRENKKGKRRKPAENHMPLSHFLGHYDGWISWNHEPKQILH